MAKMHELLAAESDTEVRAKKALTEAEKTFKEKPNLFLGMEKRWEMFDEKDQENAPPTEFQKMETTVEQKLEYLEGAVGPYYDALYQKDSTNQVAVADVMIDGKVVLAKIPATHLLALEKKLAELYKIYNAIPTLAPGVEWKKDEELDAWRSIHPVERFKTAKTFRHKTLYEATEHHPAQIEKWEETENVGKSVQNIWSGMLSSKEKSELLDRLSKLIAAIKKARARANATQVVKGKVSETIFKYIHHGDIQEIAKEG